MLGWKPLTLSWLNTLPKSINSEMKELILENFDRLVPPLLNFLRKGGVKVGFLNLLIHSINYTQNEFYIFYLTKRKCLKFDVCSVLVSEKKISSVWKIFADIIIFANTLSISFIARIV